MAGGRQTEYTEFHNEKALKYVGGGWKEDGSVIPSIAGLALHLGVARTTVYKWADENDEFSYTLERLLSKQELKALNNGLSSEFNAQITKLVLHNHGYTDKQELDSNVSFAMVSDEPTTEEWEKEFGSAE